MSTLEPIKPLAPKGVRRIDPVLRTLSAVLLIGLGGKDLWWLAYGSDLWAVIRPCNFRDAQNNL